MLTRAISRLRSRPRLLVVLFLAAGLGAMCTVAATDAQMAGHSGMSSMAMPGMDMSDPGAALVDAAKPLTNAAERACADCSTGECAAIATVAGVGLLTLVLLLLSRRRYALSVQRLRRTALFAGPAPPPPLRLTPPRFHLCVLRV